MNVRSGKVSRDAVKYVGRRAGGWPESPYGNPFKVLREQDRVPAVVQYCGWLADQTAVLNDIVSYSGFLKDNDLPHLTFACWCAPKLCHAEVIADLYDYASVGADVVALADRCRVLSEWIAEGARYPFSPPPEPTPTLVFAS